MDISDVLEIHFPEVDRKTRDQILWATTDVIRLPKESSIDPVVLASKQLLEFRQFVNKKMLSSKLPIDLAVSHCLDDVFEGNIQMDSWL